MKRLSFAIAIALCMTTFVAAPAAATEHCQSPAEGVTVCDDDGDGEPDLVEIVTAEEGTGALTVRYENSTGFFGGERVVEVTATTSEESPVGATEANARVICGYDSSDVPCTDVQSYTWADESLENGASASASCDELGSGPTPACTIAGGAVDVNAGETGARGVFICGSQGFFGPGTPCPLELKSGIFVTTPAGDLVAFAGAQPEQGSAFVCLDNPATGLQCAP